MVVTMPSHRARQVASLVKSNENDVFVCKEFREDV